MRFILSFIFLITTSLSFAAHKTLSSVPQHSVHSHTHRNTMSPPPQVLQSHTHLKCSTATPAPPPRLR